MFDTVAAVGYDYVTTLESDFNRTLETTWLCRRAESSALSQFNVCRSRLSSSSITKSFPHQLSIDDIFRTNGSAFRFQVTDIAGPIPNLSMPAI